GLPDPDGLISDGWTACTDADAGVKIAVQRTQELEELTDEAFLVASGNKLWLIAPSPGVGGEPGRAHRFEMPRDEVMVGAISDALGFGASPPQVEREWLNLFPPGAPLAKGEFHLADEGQPFEPSDGSSTLSRYR